jgi:ferredoxin
MRSTAADSYSVSIFVAGDAADARRICRDFCTAMGECVTVSPTEYVYAGGSEPGVIVGLINYPRFPRDQAAIEIRAQALAEKLIVGLSQWSASIQTPSRTVWLTRRPDTPEAA